MENKKYWIVGGGTRTAKQGIAATLKVLKTLLEQGVTNITIMDYGDRAMERAVGKAVDRVAGEAADDDGSPLVEQSGFTNIQAAMREAHKVAAQTGQPCYCYGESGKYRMSQEKPEAELRYIQVTPSGNEWTWSYNPSADRWTKTRLGVIGDKIEGVDFDRMAQLAGLTEDQ